MWESFICFGFGEIHDIVHQVVLGCASRRRYEQLKFE
jgi:hypothetical protein